jgi:hypothetical protein
VPELAKLANDAPHANCGARDRVPELDSGRAVNSPWGVVPGGAPSAAAHCSAEGERQLEAGGVGRSMTAEQRYLFDCCGFVHLRGVPRARPPPAVSFGACQTSRKPLLNYHAVLARPTRGDLRSSP